MYTFDLIFVKAKIFLCNFLLTMPDVIEGDWKQTHKYKCYLLYLQCSPPDFIKCVGKLLSLFDITDYISKSVFIKE